MNSIKILWLEDQISDLETFKSMLFRKGYLIDIVSDISEAVKMFSNNEYMAYIFDIRVPPGPDSEWQKLDRKKLRSTPDHDSHLGLELLRSIFLPEQSSIKLSLPFKIKPRQMIVLSVIIESFDELKDMGIPPNQLISKSSCDISTLLNLIKKIQMDSSK